MMNTLQKSPGGANVLDDIREDRGVKLLSGQASRLNVASHHDRPADPFIRNGSGLWRELHSCNLKTSETGFQQQIPVTTANLKQPRASRRNEALKGIQIDRARSALHLRHPLLSVLHTVVEEIAATIDVGQARIIRLRAQKFNPALRASLQTVRSDRRYLPNRAPTQRTNRPGLNGVDSDLSAGLHEIETVIDVTLLCS
jgi:hypothetical protein